MIAGERNLPLRFQIEGALVSVPGLRRLVQVAQGKRKQLNALLEKRRRNRSPQNLNNYELKVYSQNGEDGIIREIFRRIGATNKLFVEFGVQDGTECCSRHLLENGWNGVWMEADETLVDRARQTFASLPIKVIHKFLDRENIVPAFQQAGVPPTFDFMCIDTNGNDYWLWEAVATQFRPRVVLVEYNASFGPRLNWIMPYDPHFIDDDTVYFGATLRAYVELGVRLGYELVGCDVSGVNAFFVRRELVNDDFECVADPLQHYMTPKYDAWYGHPVKRL